MFHEHNLKIFRRVYVEDFPEEGLPAGLVVGELLQRQGSPGDVLCEGLLGVAVAAVEAHGVVHGKAGVPPAQEGGGKPLADEAQLQELSDGASAQALAQARGIVDGEEEEPAVGIEAALEDEGMEMGVEAGESPKGC
jgi:hypothetical protein